MPEDKIISIQNVGKSYIWNGKKEEVFNKFNLDITYGEITCILGQSGCGKTTLLNMISNIDKPDEEKGEIVWDEESMKQHIGYVFQDALLLPWRNAYKNATLGMEIVEKKKKIKNSNRSIINDLFIKFGLEHVKDSYPDQLSGGMKSRISIIRALATEPLLLLLDEPFSQLDYVNKLFLEKMICDEVLDRNITIIFVTHDINEAIAIGNKIVMISRNENQPSEIKYDESIIFNTDKSGRDPIVVRGLEKFGEYFNKITYAMSNDNEED